MSAYGATLEDAQDVTAFRLAEKKYKLHLQQQMRYRGGRMRGGKLVAQPTDLSDVIDVRSAATAGTHPNFQIHHLPKEVCSCNFSAQAGCCSNSCSCGSSTVHQTQQAVPATPSQQETPCRQTIALTFPGHPGLIVVPNALGALQQFHLMRAALTQWPEHPTRTNHTKMYGARLAGLFAAAQAGLALIEQQPSQQQPTRQCQHQEGAPELLSYQPALEQVSAAAAAVTECSSYRCNSASQQHQQQQGTGSPAAPAQSSELQCNTSCCCSRPQVAPSFWSADGKGPKAAVLLRKLRWASLGPPFNWTDRVYEHHVEHTQLPVDLADIGCIYATLAAEVTRLSESSTCQPKGDPGHVSSQAATGFPVDKPCTVQQAPEPTLFKPDVALVNYYHAGDTLGGHQDDVEPDMTQPIVTMSLGCEAVFLIGGSSREQVPTALLLRSGDVVVLGGPARSCYHGVPRIFTDKGLPEELDIAVQRYPHFGPYLEYFKQCRVNISIRCID